MIGYILHFGKAKMKRVKYEKGILGIKKDPKNQILFSFRARQGEEWPSDDSDDSDYVPDDPEEETKPGKRKREKAAKNDKVKRKTNDTLSKVQPKVGEARRTVCSTLPEEIWHKIFHIVVTSYGPLPFLCRAAKVCRLWNDIAKHPSLWIKVDLSYGWIKSSEYTLTWLMQNRLAQCQDLNLSGWGSVNDGLLKRLSLSCGALTSVNVSHCKKLQVEGITAMVDNCPHLRDVDVSFTNVSVQALKHLVKAHGSNLRQLNLGGNKYVNFHALFDLIITTCGNLELLDVSNTRFSSEFVSIKVRKFQEGCKKMKILRLGNTKFREISSAQVNILGEEVGLPGFPDLEEMSLGCKDTVNSAGFTESMVMNLISKSSRLKLLDLVGCVYFGAGSDSWSLCQSLACLDLEELYLSQSFVGESVILKQFLLKWGHSLRVLDIAWNTFKHDNLNQSLENFVRSPGSANVDMLNLAGTNTDEENLRLLLLKCPKLRYINLSSCRALPRGIKREYSAKDIGKLKAVCKVK